MHDSLNQSIKFTYFYLCEAFQLQILLRSNMRQILFLPVYHMGQEIIILHHLGYFMFHHKNTATVYTIIY